MKTKTKTTRTKRETATVKAKFDDLYFYVVKLNERATDDRWEALTEALAKISRAKLA